MSLKKSMKAEMKIVSPDDDIFRLYRDERAGFPNARAFYWKAIEDTGGFPYHLIPGQKPEEDNIIITGEGITNLLGVRPEDFTEKAFISIIDKIESIPGDAPVDLAEIHRKILNGNIEGYKAEMLIRTAGGERKWVRYVSIQQIDEETGKVTGVFGILYDITESRLMRERAEKISQREEEYNRLKTYFLQNISHEIRTPLNAILGFSALISEYPDGADPERLKEYREIMNDNSDRLLNIIDSVIEMSKIEAGTVKFIRSKVNLNWVLLKVYGQFRIDASLKSVPLVFETPLAEREANIYADEFKLTSILRNLVGNAVKFTAEGRIEFGYSIKGDKIEFYVSDTGIGIPGEYQDVIFREFYQADSSFSRSYGGVGLGLAISKAYVEMLGGKIWISPETDRGSVFRFTIPYESAEGNAT